MHYQFLARVSVGFLVLVLPTWAWGAVAKPIDDWTAVYLYHKLSGEPLDVEAIAQGVDRVRRANNFDRPELLKKETNRIQAEYDAADPEATYLIRVGTNATYEHDKERFAIGVFEPGVFIDFQPYRRSRIRYRVSFANREAVQYIRMPKQEARALDQVFRQGGTVATIEVRIIGTGDPTGAVDSENTLRAEIVALQYLNNQTGAVVHDPGPVAPYDRSQDPPVVAYETFDILKLRPGIALDAMKKNLEQQFGKTVPVSPTKKDDPRLMRGVGYEPMGCYSFGKKKTKAGNVCISAYPDKGGVIRKIVVEQIIEGNDWEGIRLALLNKYGAVAESANKANTQYYGWGPRITKSVTMDEQLAPQRA